LHSPKKVFVKYKKTLSKEELSKEDLCRVSDVALGKGQSLPSAYPLALGKGRVSCSMESGVKTLLLLSEDGKQTIRRSRPSNDSEGISSSSWMIMNGAWREVDSDWIRVSQ